MLRARTRRCRCALFAALPLAAAAVGLLGCNSEKPAAHPGDGTSPDSVPGDRASGDGTEEVRKVYTNEDLEKLPPLTTLPEDDGSPGVLVAPAREGSSEPRSEPAAETRASVEDAEQRVAAASAQVAELEKRLLAIRNPLLPRPQLPPEEAQAWEGLDGIQRAGRVEGQLASAREELADAEAELARRRSATAS